MAEHLALKDLKELLSTYGQKIPIGSVWSHWKKPDVHYAICDLVIDEATDMVSVIYEHDWIRFARLADIFVEVVDTVSYQWPRFTRIE